MKMKTYALTFALLSAGGVSLIAGFGHAAQETCVARNVPQTHSAQGYGLVDFLGGGVWGTRDWSPEGFESFSIPALRLMWHKADPRVPVADETRVVQSPGCDAPGEFTFRTAFGREFAQVSTLQSRGPVETYGGLIDMLEVEQHRTLVFHAGRSVPVLTGPDGAQFLQVSQLRDHPGFAADLPEGWSVSPVELTQELTVSHQGPVRLLRLNNGDTFAGPLPVAGAFGA